MHSFIGRVAGIELQVAHHVLTDKKITNKQLQELECNAGIFCKDPTSIQEYAKQLIRSYERCTSIATWENTGSVYAITGQSQDWLERRTPQIPKIPAKDLEPYYNSSFHLTGKRILIIHHFVSSLQKQVTRLPYLFQTPWCSECSFQFVSPPVTFAGNHQNVDWQVHLQSFLSTVPLDFDIALIAAGGYGMLIADHLFQKGKSVMYVGGALQLFFGVIGKRWFTNSDIMKLVNTHWIRPEQSEQPPGFHTVEKGCYW